MAKRVVKIDFDTVRCDWRHMTVTGKGWRRRLRELGADEGEITMLVEALKRGMAARIELARIYQLAGYEYDEVKL